MTLNPNLTLTLPLALPLPLPQNFFKKYSRHFAHSGEEDGPITLAEITARHERLVVERAELAEAEMLLVKCHALCDPNGLGYYKLSAGNRSSHSPEQCTLDCASSLVHGELFSRYGWQNRTQNANASRLLRQTKDDAAEHGRLTQAQVLLKCHAECAASGGDSSACTMDCALRRLHSSGALAAANATTAPVHAGPSGPGAEHSAERRRAKLETTRDLLEVTRALNNYTKRARFMQEGRQEASSTSPFANHTKRAAAPNEEFTQEQLLLRCHDKCSLDAEVAAGGVEQCTMDCALRHLHASRLPST